MEETLFKSLVRRKGVEGIVSATEDYGVPDEKGTGRRETCNGTGSYSPAAALTSLAPPFLVLGLATNRK